MKNLAHSASFHSTEKIAPSKAGIKQVGPVAGFALALAAVIGIAPTAEWALIGYAGAQAVTLIWLLRALHVAPVRWPIPRQVIRTALAFGLPIVVAGAIGWISLNGIRVVVEHNAGATAVWSPSAGASDSASPVWRRRSSPPRRFRLR